MEANGRNPPFAVFAGWAKRALCGRSERGMADRISSGGDQMPHLDSFTIPEFHLPFENTKDPGAERANAEATDWVVQGASSRRLRRSSQGSASATCRPGSRTAPRTTTSSCWRSGWPGPSSWTTSTTCSSGTAASTTGAPSPPRSTATWRTGGPTASRRPPGTPGRRLHRAVRPHPRPHAAPAARALPRPRPAHAGFPGPGGAQPQARLPAPVADYVLTRRHSSQLLPMMDMVEGFLGIEVPAAVHDHPEVQELGWSAIDVISWGNDVFSLPKGTPAATPTTWPRSSPRGRAGRCRRR